MPNDESGRWASGVRERKWKSDSGKQPPTSRLTCSLTQRAFPFCSSCLAASAFAFFVEVRHRVQAVRFLAKRARSEHILLKAGAGNLKGRKIWRCGTPPCNMPVFYSDPLEIDLSCFLMGSKHPVSSAPGSAGFHAAASKCSTPVAFFLIPGRFFPKPRLIRSTAMFSLANNLNLTNGLVTLAACRLPR